MGLTEHKELCQFLFFILLEHPPGIMGEKKLKLGCFRKQNTYISKHYIFQNAHPLQRKSFGL
jgi:hypothetical protein